LDLSEGVQAGEAQHLLAVLLLEGHEPRGMVIYGASRMADDESLPPRIMVEIDLAHMEIAFCGWFFKN
jgi:hypothetical protein